MKTNRVNKSYRFFLSCGYLAAVLLILMSSHPVIAQYEDSPLKGEKWYTVATGVNSMDYVSWQVMGSFSSRGENVLTQLRFGYSQELIQPTIDSCASRLNRLSEAGILWGDGWAGKKWYVTGAIGFGINVRMFCRHKSYEDTYITAITMGLPAQIEFGVKVSKNVGINMVGCANWNFRAPYVGGMIGMFYKLN